MTCGLPCYLSRQYLHITQQKCNGLDAVAIVYAIEALYEVNAQ